MSIKEDFNRDGFVVIRGAIPERDVRDWQECWSDWNAAVLSKGRKIDRFNPVCVQETMPPTLANMRKHPAILDVVEQVFGPDIALYNHRMLVKDKHARGPVFLHQDTGYHVGWPTKASAFVPLVPVNIMNGCMAFSRGSHKLGYLGDAGQIEHNIHVYPPFYVDLSLGDFVLMHSACWHNSSAHTEGPDRVMADLIVQPADDPSGIELLRGEWRCEPQPWLRQGNLFVRSRVTRLKELQSQLDAVMEGKA